MWNLGCVCRWPSPSGSFHGSPSITSKPRCKITKGSWSKGRLLWLPSSRRLTGLLSRSGQTHAIPCLLYPGCDVQPPTHSLAYDATFISYRSIVSEAMLSSAFVKSNSLWGSIIFSGNSFMTRQGTGSVAVHTYRLFPNHILTCVMIPPSSPHPE